METLVFTNGCFDLIHPGHIDLLKRARELGTKLIVGINSDESVRKIKGFPRPYLSQDERAVILQSLEFVDEVRIFDETTPEKLIRAIKPDVLVKGGDWKTNEIVGADFVQKAGGKVFSLSLKDGYSSSSLIDKIRNKTIETVEADSTETGLVKKVKASLEEHLEVAGKLLENDIANIEKCAELIYKTFEQGNKVLICGNGGSAADAQHLAAEFIGRFEKERKALPAIALTTDTSAITALANDYSFERIYARQVEALAETGDLLIGISTSGNSPNVIAAVMLARHAGCKTLGMTGATGKKLASLCDACLMIPSTRTARIQESHITVAHIWCEIIDAKFAAL